MNAAMTGTADESRQAEGCSCLPYMCRRLRFFQVNNQFFQIHCKSPIEVSQTC